MLTWSKAKVPHSKLIPDKLVMNSVDVLKKYICVCMYYIKLKIKPFIIGLNDLKPTVGTSPLSTHLWVFCFVAIY